MAVALALLPATGCGFIHASGVSHNKPNGFVLRGHVTVPLPASTSQAAGTACSAPGSASDIVAGAPVKVTDPNGRQLALGSLGAGVFATGTGVSCDFPFEIRAVPGGVDSYAISVAGRPAQTFPAKALREDQAAVITING